MKFAILPHFDTSGDMMTYGVIAKKWIENESSKLHVNSNKMRCIHTFGNKRLYKKLLVTFTAQLQWIL